MRDPGDKIHPQLLALMGGQAASLSKFYASQTRQIARALRGYSLKNPLDPWQGNKLIEKRVQKVLEEMGLKYQGYVKSSMERAVKLSNGHIDDITKQFTKNIELSKAQELGYAFRNQAAIGGWISRRVEGLNLSSRVWNIADQTKAQMETYLSEGLADGRSAKKMATDLKQYLRNPDKRFRRVRDKKTGKLKLSKPAQGYHPGRGVYRSSYANALRVARNETNLAYRENDYLRVQNLDFVKGIRVNLSPAHPEYDICDELKGDYPKKFRFSGWHPNCLCYTTTILESRKDFIDRMNGKAKRGGDVTRIPKRATRYLNQNADQIKAWNNKPYFLENFKGTKDGFALRADVGQPNVLDTQLNQDYSNQKVINRNIMLARDAGLDSNDLYRDDDGNLIPQRAALRANIVDKLVSEGKAKTNTVNVLGGAPANGKSTFTKSKYFKPAKGTLQVDSDSIKAELPEYQTMVRRKNPIAAAFAHEESSAVSKEVIQAALVQKKDFILDGVNDGPLSKVITKFEAFKDGGRNRLVGNYVTLDSDLSYKLAEARGKKTGRVVPLDYIKAMNKEMPTLIQGLIRNRTMDELYLWDTNTEGIPKLILKQIDGEVTMYDEDLWQRFLRKASE